MGYIYKRTVNLNKTVNFEYQSIEETLYNLTCYKYKKI